VYTNNGSPQIMAEDEQFNQAFGEHTAISADTREYINEIKNNYPLTTSFNLGFDDIDGFITDLAWRLLGRYIANNTYLTKLDLEECSLSDEKIISLFSGLTSSKSLDRLDLDGNDFGIDGVRSIIPLLQNCPHLSTLWLAGNRRIDSECFEVLVRALHGRSIEKLYTYQCNITDITALDRYSLPNLQTLSLSNNKIGREGCITISNLLQKEGSKLTRLSLDSTGMENEGAEILSSSLRNNKKLQILELNQNDINERGHKAFLKVLVDISSIGNTYKSNHTLTTCELNEYDGDNTHAKALKDACKENRLSSTKAAGRAKVIKYQLDSQKRKKLSELQGIEYSSIGNLLADIEVNLLPQILALIGREHGHSEFYSSLLPLAPDLLSFINREAILEEERAKNTLQAANITSQIAALTQQLSSISTKNDQIDKRLALIKLGSKQMAVVDEGKDGGSGEKRQRID